jgi:hypothetical protein
MVLTRFASYHPALKKLAFLGLTNLNMYKVPSTKVPLRLLEQWYGPAAPYRTHGVAAKATSFSSAQQLGATATDCFSWVGSWAASGGTVLEMRNQQPAPDLAQFLSSGR